MPIGCRKDPEEKCHLLIAEDTRWIIEKIYALAVRGVGAAKTSKVLTQGQRIFAYVPIGCRKDPEG